MSGGESFAAIVKGSLGWDIDCPKFRAGIRVRREMHAQEARMNALNDKMYAARYKNPGKLRAERVNFSAQT